VIGYDGFKRITGTKIHVAVEQNGFPISIVYSSANIHDSTKFVDVMALTVHTQKGREIFVTLDGVICRAREIRRTNRN